MGLFFLFHIVILLFFLILKTWLTNFIIKQIIMSKTLIAYYTLSWMTKKVAEKLADMTGWDLKEIQLEKPTTALQAYAKWFFMRNSKNPPKLKGKQHQLFSLLLHTKSTSSIFRGIPPPVGDYIIVLSFTEKLLTNAKTGVMLIWYVFIK